MCLSIQCDLLTWCMFFYLRAVIDPYKSMQHLFGVENAVIKMFYSMFISASHIATGIIFKHEGQLSMHC